MSGLSRRALLAGAGGFLLGGTLVGAAGLGYREYRRRHFVTAHGSMVTLPHREDDGWLLSAQDRAEFAAADELVASGTFEIREGADLPGDEIRSFRAGSLQDCVSACEAEADCQGFSFARASHPVPQDRRICRLKGAGAGAAVPAGADLVAGRRGGF